VERANIAGRRHVDSESERGLVVDTVNGEVRIDGAPPPAALGPTEYRLLQALAARNGALVSKDDVAREVWPQEQRLGGVDDARIDKLIDRVRSKIEPNPRTPRYLVTVRGLGYRLLSGAEPAP
jgi:DNA-binding response OmpR family regulator